MGRGIWLVFFILLNAGCSPYQSASSAVSSTENQQGEITPPPEPPPSEITIEKARWESVRADSRVWTEYVFHQMDVDGLDLLAKEPADIRNFCPNYSNLNRSQRKNFWVYLISAIAHFESAYDPTTKYTESFTDSAGARVVSRGLLQLSIESARGYDCLLQAAEDLHQPLVNLACGLRILNRWVGRDGVIRAESSGWKGGARYWSVLRREAQFAAIRGWTASQGYCRLPSS